MSKHIAHIIDGIEMATFVGPTYTPAQAALALGLEDGAWREISPEEAAALQAPTAEDLRQQRLAEIDARLHDLTEASAPHTEIIADLLSLAAAEQRPPSDEERYLLDLHGAWIADYREERAELEAEAAALREERKGMG